MKLLINTDEHRGKKDFIKKISAIFCVYLWLIFLVFQTQAQTYTNPVIPGDFPDPSVIRVGQDYYATATTGGWSPHFPILHSKDLINWKIVSAVFREKPAWTKGDFWAPEIIQDKGRFFVYYTARRNDGKNKKGTLCVAVAVADKPDGIWQDRGTLVCQEMGSIDGAFTRDENGNPFLIWKEDGNDRQQPTWLYAQRLDESGTKLLGKPTRLFRNTESWEGIAIEGAYVLRRNGWFYLFYSGNACCGRSCNYALGVARSKTLLGKWEKNPANPILAENEIWQCPGHGSIVDAPDGRSFLLYHAFRKGKDAFKFGREAMLDEVIFADGWATINGGKGASGAAAVPFKNTKQQSIFANLNDNFNSNPLSAMWSQPLLRAGDAQIEGGFLTLAPTAKQLAGKKTPEIIVTERIVSDTYRAAARIDVSRLTGTESAGISAYGWNRDAVGISVGNNRIFIWRRKDGVQKEISSVPLPAKTKKISLIIDARDISTYYFSYETGDGDARTIGDKVNISSLEGTRIALVYSGRNTQTGVRFDQFRVAPK